MNVFIFIATNLLIGATAGIITGLGIGGGTILIPALNIFFGMKQQMSQTLNLLYFIPTAVCALAIHIKNKNVDKKIFGGIIFTSILGSIIGSYFATKFKPELLKKVFGYFLLIVGVREIFFAPDNQKSLQK